MDENFKFIMQRLTNVEEELKELREVTWPVCQKILDRGNELNNIENKIFFFKDLDPDECKKLLKLKNKLMHPWGGGLVSQEYRSIYSGKSAS